jgi:hypothetical protein
MDREYRVTQWCRRPRVMHDFLFWKHMKPIDSRRTFSRVINMFNKNWIVPS